MHVYMNVPFMPLAWLWMFLTRVTFPLIYAINEIWRQPKLRNSLRKHGYDAHKVEIVLQCGKHELDMYERKFIAVYDSKKKD